MVKDEYFEKENEFLITLGKLYGKMKIYVNLNITPELLLEKEYNLVYCDMRDYNDKLMYYDAILQKKNSNIYIYLSRKDVGEKYYQVRIYFDPEEFTESRFFIKNLLKLKDGD